MKKELEKQIFDKYPELFARKDLPARQTCMCWGLECGNGWYRLIDATCGQITQHVKNVKSQAKYKYDYAMKTETDEEKKKKLTADYEEVMKFSIQAEQVKQKWGGLRFYTTCSDDHTDGIIDLAEALSYDTCEDCGSMDNVKSTTGWITPLCGKCYKKWERSMMWGRFLTRIGIQKYINKFKHWNTMRKYKKEQAKNATTI
jgi:hypothetical protein